jgi:3-oxoacyl-[acyl-carrier-protein] synthase-1
LGAAGGLEAIISALALQQGFLPGGVNTRRVDPAIPVQYLSANRETTPHRVLSNSFGFGGTNCSLILGRAQ